MDIGFVGVGVQGAPMVERILGAGFPTTVWARREASTRPFAGRARIAAGAAELGASCDVVGVCVWDDDDVREVVAGRDGLLDGVRPGTVIAVHSTTSPELCRELGAAALDRGCTVVDAPVSGGAERARLGTLVVMVGGDDESVARCRPVFETFGSTIVSTGPLGSGQTVKLINNALFAAQLSLAVDAFRLAEEAGIGKATLGECLSEGSGSSRALRFHAQRVLVEDGPFAPSPIFRKDVELCAGLPGFAGSALLAAARRPL
ncbi:NAD(P)-dependent oxidoreductase [Pseudonocardia ailaonensis]|uniref:NAD(P)-dependent oxidoreductase n=1 Tax=Pseudonocardia ailaonensis TaxID=367279 RepID=A0ABN2N3C0_9PSEU